MEKETELEKMIEKATTTINFFQNATPKAPAENQNENLEKLNQDFEKQLENFDKPAENCNILEENFGKPAENINPLGENFETQTENFDTQTENFETQTANYASQTEAENENNATAHAENVYSSTLQTPNYDFIQTTAPASDNNAEDIKKKHKKKQNFRRKLCACVFCILSVCALGWVVGNSIHINNLNADIADAEYQISEIQYIIKISQLDNYQEITNGENNAISSIVEITPPPLINPTQPQPQTNWFDSII